MSKTPEEIEKYKVYQKYIKSKEFKEIKQLVLERDGYKCKVCSATNEERTLVCHHNSYLNLYNERDHLEDLITLCSTDHYAIHSKPMNYKRFKL